MLLNWRIWNSINDLEGRRVIVWKGRKKKRFGPSSHPLYLSLLNVKGLLISCPSLSTEGEDRALWPSLWTPCQYGCLCRIPPWHERKQMPRSVWMETFFFWPLFQLHHWLGPPFTSVDLPHLSILFILYPSPQLYSKEDGSQVTKDDYIFFTLNVYSSAPVYFIMLLYYRSERTLNQQDWHRLTSLMKIFMNFQNIKQMRLWA